MRKFAMGAALLAVEALYLGAPGEELPLKGARQTAAVDRFTLASVEQTEPGTRTSPEIVASFEGLGEGFEGPQGTAAFRNPSDNSLAVGPDHIVQIVNSRMAVFTKKGSRFKETGKVLYGPVATNNVFRAFGAAGTINNGDAVVRYDQLADRWLIVMPIFRRLPPRKEEPPIPRSDEPAHRSRPGVEGQPGPAVPLFQPPRPALAEKEAPAIKAPGGKRAPENPGGSYAMCYAVSTGSDPLGSYYRYEFVRPLFPDYPRPAIWPDGYYVPTSTGDNVIQKQAYVAERAKMLKGEPATEQGLILDGVNFLNNADLDGTELPPEGAPNIVMATGGAQLHRITWDDGIYVWMYHVDWNDPAKTRLDGRGNIGIGYSFGGTPHFAGQRFAGRLSDDPPGVLTFREAVLVEGEAAQTNTLRWMDYSQTAMDPGDDLTIWYAGDYLKKGAANYSTRIGAFRLSGSQDGR